MNIKLATLLITLSFSAQSYASSKSIQVDKSQLKWSATKKIGSGHHGTLKITNGEGVLKGSIIEKAEIIADMTSIDVTDGITGEDKAKLIGHLKAKDFFGINEKPENKTAKLTISSPSENGIAKGSLTIKGLTHPVTIKYEIKGDTAKGSFVFDRTKYDIKYASSNFFANLAGNRIINDEVKIEFNVKLK